MTTTSMRTHQCGQLRPEHIGLTVSLCGWVATRREHGEKLAFIDVRDHSGVSQCVVDNSVDVRAEYVVRVTGTVTARPGSLSADGTAAVVLEVEDTGIGVEEADLRKVFRPLFTTKPGGSGLGLSFCRQTVEEHGGEIRLGSQKGQGTRVTLLLPLRQEAEVFESTHFER